MAQGYADQLKKLRAEIASLKKKQGAKRTKAAHPSIQKHKHEIKQIRTKLAKLEKRKRTATLRPTVGFNNSVNKLNKNVEALLDLFNQTHEEIQKGVIQPDKEILEKLNILLTQNEKIAQGIIAVADLVKGQPETADENKDFNMMSEPLAGAVNMPDMQFKEQNMPAPTAGMQDIPDAFGQSPMQEDFSQTMQNSEEMPQGMQNQQMPQGMQNQQMPQGMQNQQMPDSMQGSQQEQWNSKGQQQDMWQYDFNYPPASPEQEPLFPPPPDDSIKSIEPTAFPSEGEPLFDTPFNADSRQDQFGQGRAAMEVPPPPPRPVFQSQNPDQMRSNYPGWGNMKPIQQNAAPVPPFGARPAQSSGRLQLRPFDNEQK